MRALLASLVIFLLSSKAFASTSRWEELCVTDADKCFLIYFDDRGIFTVASKDKELIQKFRQLFPYSDKENFNYSFFHPTYYDDVLKRYAVQRTYTTSQTLFEAVLEAPDEQYNAWRDSIYCGGAVVSCAAATAGTVSSVGWAIPVAIITCTMSVGQCMDAARSVNKWLVKKKELDINVGRDKQTNEGTRQPRGAGESSGSHSSPDDIKIDGRIPIVHGGGGRLREGHVYTTFSE